MMQPQSTLFRGPNEHVGPLKKDQCALTPKTCPLRKALQWGEVGSRRDPGERARAYGEPPAPSPQPSPQWREGARRVRGEACASSLLLLARAHHLLLQHAPDVEPELSEFRRSGERHEVARVRKRHVDDFFDAARMRRHDHGAI